ncbi:MAG TPA: Mur ligase family protein [bacterium]|nr:Mur ligase family protein [bacterium]
MILRLKIKAEIILYFFLKYILNNVFNREGDVLPVHILKKIDKDTFDNFASYIHSYGIPIIFVTGTNGKTTTANLIADTLRAAGKNVCVNSNGANMSNGVFGAIIGSYGLSTIDRLLGLDFQFNADFIVIEADEKVFPYLSSKLMPNVVVITNFYRDQLDRYGEINTTVFEIKRAIKNLSGDTMLILPSFEPLAMSVGYGINNPRIYYGFKREFFKEKQCQERAVSSDALTCPYCKKVLFNRKDVNQNVFLLKFKCENCGFTNIEPDIYISGYKGEKIIIKSNKIGAEYDGKTDGALYSDFKPALSGDYNMANYLAAYSVLKNYKIKNDIIIPSFENFQTKFGRSFKKYVGDLEINVDLVKNPTGLSRVLEKITDVYNNDLPFIDILFAFSDRDADGRDVSWIWDVEFEKYVKDIGKIIITGLRPFDMAIRLKTAGVDKSLISIEHNLKKSLKKIIKIGRSQVSSNKKVFILSTYTELLRIKKYIM